MTHHHSSLTSSVRTLLSLLLPTLSAVGVTLPISGSAQALPSLTLPQVQTAIAEVEKIAQQQITKAAVPGMAIAVVFQDKLIYAKGFGIREVGNNQPVDADTVFQLASLSKPVGATVVAALVGDQTITWDSKLNDLDPAFAMTVPWVTHEVTVRDMYSHRSGLPEHAGDLLEDLGYNRAEVLHSLRYQKPDTSFRSHYAYTNFGLTAAAVAAAKTSGLDWETLSDQKLYQPLGMISTSSRFKDFMARTNKATNHVKIDGTWTHHDQRNPDAQSPAGGVSSSVNDLSKWMRLQMNQGTFEGKPIVKPEPLAETQFPQMISGKQRGSDGPTHYGLGWDIGYDKYGRTRLSHSGAFAMGAATRVTLLPAEKLGIVILTNAAPVGVAEGLTAIFMDLAVEGTISRDWLELFTEAFKDPKVFGVESLFDYSKPPYPQIPSLKYDSYLGTYGDSALVGEIEIIAQNDQLALVIGPKKLTLPLHHYARDTFTYETLGENAAGSSGVTFSIGADGRATDVVIENLNKYGQGGFHRASSVAPGEAQ